MPRQRLGVVLLIPPPAAGEIDVLRRAVGDEHVDRIAPHLTLVPPVNVRDDDLDAAVDLLRDAAQRTTPFTITLGPAATFLPINPVLHLDIGGDVAAVDALRDKVFRPPLERTLTWPFHPHVTLRDDADEQRIRAGVDALRDYRVEITFEAVHLLREHEGRVWRPAFEAPFGEPLIVGRGGVELELEVGRGVDEPLVVTARRDGRVVGVARGFTGRLLDVHVDPDQRQQGIGAKLVAAFVAASGEPVTAPDHQFFRRVGLAPHRRS